MFICSFLILWPPPSSHSRYIADYIPLRFLNTHYSSYLPVWPPLVVSLLHRARLQPSQFWGDKSTWPVYLTISNISKDVCCETSSHATVLVSYVPVGKFDCYSEAEKQYTHYCVFHHCMNVILKSVKEEGRQGVTMTCSDWFEHWIWPAVAAYIADYPEQCLVACCKENWCPLCQVGHDNHGDHDAFPLCDMAESLSMMEQSLAGESDTDFNKQFDKLGIHALPNPF